MLTPLLSRLRFLQALAGLAGFAAPPEPSPAASGPKILLVVAHPDDEYTFAATVYRLAREFNSTVDQLIVTNGEGGYKYATLAESLYGVGLTTERIGRAALPEIRKRETLAAGRILGIRRHYFLDERDTGFTTDPAEPWNTWNRPRVLRFLTDLLQREQYQFVFTLLPTAETHGHHQAATLLALEAAAALPVSIRPAVLGSEPALAAPVEFSERPGLSLTRLWQGAPVFAMDRRRPFGYHEALNYHIVVNWTIAEHKSQGLFQTDCNKHDWEYFWLFAGSGSGAPDAVSRLFHQLSAPPSSATARTP